jgi:hypothetical protein
MSQVVYERVRLGSQHSLFMFAYLAIKRTLNSRLDSISKQAKLKYNNVFVNMKLDLNIYIIIILYV